MSSLNSSDTSRDMSNSSLPSSPGVTIVQTPRAGTLIPNRIFVGGFPPGTVEHELRSFFEQFGDVKDVKIVRDCTGVCKGYGFITYETDEEAKNIQAKCGVLEFKGRQLNIGPAIRKASSLSRTIDLIPQGAVLCNNGMPLTFQNGLTVLASPDTYAVAQPTPANSVAYPVVVPQQLYVAPPLLCPQLQCLNTQQLQGISYAGQTPNSNQNNSKTQGQQSASATLANSASNISPVTAMANLAISSSPVSGAGQFRWASPAMPGPVATQYVCPNATGFPNILQEIPAYDATMGTCYHEYPADVFSNVFDTSVEPIRPDSSLTLRRPVMATASKGAAGSDSRPVYHVARFLPWHPLLPLPPAPSLPALHGKAMRWTRGRGYACGRKAAARNMHSGAGSPRKLGQCCVTPNIHASSPRYSTVHQRCGYKYISKAPPPTNAGTNGLTKTGSGTGGAAGCEIDTEKTDVEQLAGNVVTPPPTPIS